MTQEVPFENGQLVCLGNSPTGFGRVVECSPNGTTLVAMYPVKTHVRLPHCRWRAAEERQRRVLVVDDEPVNLRTASRKLKSMKFDVLTASNVDEALNVLNAQHIDIVVTDLEMPNKNGEHLAKEVKKYWPNIKVFLHSCRPDKADASLFDAVIEKGELAQLEERT